MILHEIGHVAHHREDQADLKVRVADHLQRNETFLKRGVVRDSNENIANEISIGCKETMVRRQKLKIRREGEREREQRNF